MSLVADRVTYGAREVASVPLSTDLTLPDASSSPCVSVPVLTGVGVDIGSRKVGIGQGILKGVWIIFSNWLRKEEHTRDLGMATEMGSSIGPEGGVGNSLIRSATSSSGPVCIVSIRVDGAGVLASNPCLSFSSSSLTTSSITMLTSTSLVAEEIPTVCILGELGGSGPTGTSFS